MIADTVTTRTEIVIFVWVSRIEICDKMISEKRFDASFDGFYRQTYINDW